MSETKVKNKTKTLQNSITAYPVILGQKQFILLTNKQIYLYIYFRDVLNN